MRISPILGCLFGVIFVPFWCALRSYCFVRFVISRESDHSENRAHGITFRTLALAFFEAPICSKRFGTFSGVGAPSEIPRQAPGLD